jgi:antitoxin MazE
MKTAVRKWGNSLAVRIPRSFAQETRLSNGTIIDVQITRDAIVIRRSVAKKPDLKTLLAGIRPSNRHVETSWGKPVGQEAW